MHPPDLVNAFTSNRAVAKSMCFGLCIPVAASGPISRLLSTCSSGSTDYVHVLSKMYRCLVVCGASLPVRLYG